MNLDYESDLRVIVPRYQISLSGYEMGNSNVSPVLTRQFGIDDVGQAAV